MEAIQVFARRLKSARQMNNLSMEALANKVGISKQAISKYEQGEIKPNSTMLIAFADALNVDIDYFFRPYTITIDSMEFRKKSKLKASVLNEIKEKVYNNIERYIEIENILNINIPYINNYKDIIVCNIEQVIKVANKLRADWNLGLDAINNIPFILENKGIKVIHIGADTNFDGLCLEVNKSTPVIIINKNMPSERQRFTALHELAHILLNMDCSLSNKEKEQFCNIFANEILIPQTEFYKLIGKTRNDISLQELIAIQVQYGISIEALMYKAKECKVINDRRYKEFCIKKNNIPSFNKQVKESRYPKEESNRFKGLVYKAISLEIITISKASSLLNCSVNSVRNSLNLV